MRKATRSAFQIVPHSRSLQSVLPLHRYKAHKVFYYLAADDQAGHRGYKGIGARHRAALGALALGARRADAVILAADVVILDGTLGQLYYKSVRCQTMFCKVNHPKDEDN